MRKSTKIRLGAVLCFLSSVGALAASQGVISGFLVVAGLACIVAGATAARAEKK
jgi:hypothetical protein